MPFRLTVLAAALLGSALPALAQSSVQISGILDLAVRQVSNEGPGSARSMVSGSNSTSRIALTGREDLGNGVAASFHLEHGLLADTGAAAASKFWDRRSTVSLSSRALGELRLGRDFVPSYTVWSRHDPFAYVGVARSANLVSATPVGPIRSAFGSNANTTVRADNALQWIAPAGLGGFEAGVLLAPGEGGAVASGLARIVSARVGYTTANWAVAAATTRSRNSQTVAGEFKDDVIGGQVNMGPVRVTAAWRQFGYDQTRQRLTLLAAATTQGPHEFKASWVRGHGRPRGHDRGRCQRRGPARPGLRLQPVQALGALCEPGRHLERFAGAFRDPRRPGRARGGRPLARDGSRHPPPVLSDRPGWPGPAAAPRRPACRPGGTRESGCPRAGQNW